MRGETFIKAQKYDKAKSSMRTAAKILVYLTILIIGFAIGFSIPQADAAYAGDCLTYGDDLYNITCITITPIKGTPSIGGLGEWYSDQCEFEVDNGTLVMIGDPITDPPVILCTNPQLAPGTYDIRIVGYTAFYKEETRHYRGSGGGGGDCSDKDGDGIPDDIEWFMCTDWEDPDTDDDGINDFEETVEGGDGWITDPCDPDTDGDGLWDATDPCPIDRHDECMVTGGAGTITMTPTPTETPVATPTPIPTPDKTRAGYWMIGGLLALLILALGAGEYYRRTHSKKE